MAVKHINENAKEESGISLSGSDATKVFSMFCEVFNQDDLVEIFERSLKM